MSVIIKYGDYSFNNLPTPFVSRNEDFIREGNRWGSTETFTLNGVITGCRTADILNLQKQIVSGFAQNFQTFQIIEDSVSLISKENIKVESISFPEGKYAKLQDYSITLSHWPQDLFEGFYGVTSPVDSVKYSEADDGTISINRIVSCKGFNTHPTVNNALDNAKAFVDTRTGFNNVALPHFICYNGFEPSLTEFQEEINRVQGLYSVSESYVLDKYATGKGIIKYAITVDSGISQFNTATIQGTVEGFQDDTLEGARNRYKNFDLFGAVAESYEGAIGWLDINPEPFSSGIEESPAKNAITFNVTYNNDNSPFTIIEYTNQVNESVGKFQVSLNGSISARGDIGARQSRVWEAFSGISFYQLAFDGYYDFLGRPASVNTLNPKPISSGVSYDEFQGIINFNMTFDDSDIPPSGINKLESTISLTPSLHKITNIPLFDRAGVYSVIDLNLKRRALGEITLRGEYDNHGNRAVANNALRSRMNFLVSTYIGTSDLKMESYNFETGNSLSFSLSCQWSLESPFNAINTSSSYSSVNDLRLR